MINLWEAFEYEGEKLSSYRNKQKLSAPELDRRRQKAMEDAQLREQAGLSKARLALAAFGKLRVDRQTDDEVGLSFLRFSTAHIVRINSLEPPEAPEEPEPWEPSFNNPLLEWAKQDSLDAFRNNTESRVRRQLWETHGLKLRTVRHDGNCLFASLSEAYFYETKKTMTANRIRQGALALLRGGILPSWSAVKDVIWQTASYRGRNMTSLQDYLTCMERDDTWGDEAMLAAAVEFLKVRVKLYPAAEPNQEMSAIPIYHPAGEESRPTLNLVHYKELHYDWACEPTPTESPERDQEVPLVVSRPPNKKRPSFRPFYPIDNRLSVLDIPSYSLDQYHGGMVAPSPDRLSRLGLRIQYETTKITYDYVMWLVSSAMCGRSTQAEKEDRERLRNQARLSPNPRSARCLRRATARSSTSAHSPSGVTHSAQSKLDTASLSNFTF